MSARIFISSDPDNLRAALSGFSRTATVEAEYGDVVVEGTEVTLAHHGPRSDQPCPCLGGNLNIEVDAVGVSHFDLDTLGGVLRILGEKPCEDNFWLSAAFVDTYGVHKLRQHSLDNTLAKLHAFWAWSEANRLSPPRDGAVQDVTEFFAEAGRVLAVLLGNTSFEEYHQLLDAGRAWAAAKAKLEEDSFVIEKGGVILRMADSFTNHLYEHDGQVAKAVVSLNTKTNAITVSLSDPIEGVDCCAFMQRLFGPQAGGHAGIAGTPRDEVFMLHDADRVAQELALEIAVATTEVIPA